MLYFSWSEKSTFYPGINLEVADEVTFQHQSPAAGNVKPIRVDGLYTVVLSCYDEVRNAPVQMGMDARRGGIISLIDESTEGP
jgi:hypothetical protein